MLEIIVNFKEAGFSCMLISETLYSRVANYPIVHLKQKSCEIGFYLEKSCVSVCMAKFWAIDTISLYHLAFGEDNSNCWWYKEVNIFTINWKSNIYYMRWPYLGMGKRTNKYNCHIITKKGWM